MKKVALAKNDTLEAALKASIQFDSLRILAEFRIDSVQLLQIRYDLEQVNNRIDTLNKRVGIATTGSKLPMEDSIILAGSKELLSLYKKKDSLQIDTFRLGLKYRSNYTLLHDNFTRRNSIGGVSNKNTDLIEKIKDSLEMTIQLKGHRFKWISLVGGVTRNKYYSFVAGLDFSNQFTDEKYTTYTIGLEYNFLRYGKKVNLVAGKLPHVHIGNIGLVRLKSNNVGDLSTTELTDSRKYTSSDSTHSLGTKYNVYTDPITEYEAWRLYFNYYYSFGKNKDYGLHFFPDVELRNTHENPFNIAAGLIIPVKNKTDKTIFNLEFYGKLIDVGKALPQDEAKFINRNQLGISLGIPIGLPTSK
jgi:hypothetical protein